MSTFHQFGRCRKFQTTRHEPCIIIADVIKEKLKVASNTFGHHLCDAWERTRYEEKWLFCNYPQKTNAYKTSTIVFYRTCVYQMQPQNGQNWHSRSPEIGHILAVCLRNYRCRADRSNEPPQSRNCQNRILHISKIGNLLPVCPKNNSLRNNQISERHAKFGENR